MEQPAQSITLVPEDHVETDKRRPQSRFEANFLSRITFWWITPLLVLGAERPIEEEDVWEIPDEDGPSEAGPRFQRKWKAELRERSHKASVFRALLRAFGKRWYWAGFMHMLSAVCQLGQPFFVGPIVRFVADSQDDSIDEGPVGTGYGYAAGLVLSMLVAQILIHNVFYLIIRNANAMRVALMDQVYDKALRLSAAAKQGTSVGKTVNIMSTDTQRVFEMWLTLHFLWIAPLMITVVLILLVVEIGAGGFAGVFVMLAIIPIQGKLAKQMGERRRAMLAESDKRIKIVTEVLAGIRVVKFYAWERPFAKRINKLREQEVQHLKAVLYKKAISISLNLVIPVLSALSIFTVYVLTGNELDVETVFVVLALINVLRFPINLLPLSFHGLVEGRVAMDRIRDFLIQPEIQAATNSSPEPVRNTEVELDDLQLTADEHSTYNGRVKLQVQDRTSSTRTVALSAVRRAGKDSGVSVGMLTLEHCDFSWRAGSAVPLLHNIDLDVAPGTLVGVVGLVGGGKSSLLAAILGEMHHAAGSVAVNGAFGYVSQENWIRNSTLKDNILFGLPFDEERYVQAVEASALGPDIKILPDGDKTEIGERGINLSGGQKARVSMARALYRRHLCDIYLLDDPFASVDVAVGKHMFEEGVLKTLKRSGKTVIVVLNSHLHFLKQFDEIVVVGTLPTDQLAPELRVAAQEVTEDTTVPSSQTAEVDRDEEAKSDHPPNDTADDHERVLVVDDDGDAEQARGGPAVCGILARGSYAQLSVDYKSLLQAVQMDPRKRSRSGSNVEEAKGLEEPSLAREVSSQSQRSLSTGSTATDDEASPADTAKGASLIAAEDRRTGTVAGGVYAAYFAAAELFGLSGNLTIFVVLSFFALGQSGRVLSDWWLAVWSDGDILSDRSTGFWLGTYCAWAAGTFALILWRSLLFAYLAVRSSSALHSRLFMRLLRAPISTFFDVTPVGRILNRFSKDLDQVDVMLPDYMQQLLAYGFLLFAALVVCCVSSWVFLLVLLPVIYLFVTIQSYYRRTSRELKRLEGITRSPIFSSFGETISGLSTIRAFRMQNAFHTYLRHLVRRNARVFLMNQYTARWLAMRLDFVSLLVIATVAFLAIVLRFQLDEAVIGLALVYALQFTGLLQWTVRTSIETENNMTAVERLVHYATVDTEAAFDASDGPVREVSDDWPAKGAIEFRSLKLRYRPQLPLVLQGLNASIRPREKIGICGRTGAGKSSLMVALFRIVEAEHSGSILIDGVPISDVGLGDLRSRMSIIPQDPVLFSGTLRYNLDPFNVQSDEQIWEALGRVHLADAVRDFHGGLEFEVAESGANLSHGQRQLICIARALLRKSKIIVLDEATSSVDSATDSLIQSTIRSSFADCTVLTIAHRLETILHSDRILVLDQGRVVEFASPAELKAIPNGVFASLLSQSQGTHEK